MSSTAAVLAATLVLFLSSTPPSSSFPFPIPFNPWNLFQNLTGCNPGDHNPILPNLKSYLHRFGYLPPPASNFSDLFDDDLTTAILSYQRNLGLSPTGFLDPSTLSVLSLPRCGVPDIAPNSTSTVRGRDLFSYFPGTPSWPPDKRVLTYALTDTASISMDRPTLQAVFSRAFARWSAATTLNFTEVSPDVDNADITIGFYGGEHGDGEAFDGMLGTLAHAFSPTDGRFHLDAAENWVATGDVTAAAEGQNAVDLESVAVHEIGHLLGLGHSPTSEAVMYASIKTSTRKVELARDDVEGIQRLYGGNPNFGVVSEGKSSPEISGGAAATPMAGREKVLAMAVAAVAAAAAFVGLIL